MNCPSKSEIQQIFKRLTSVQANKVCFDCGSKNPTWASVTYGIFICIDCSGIHRSLGVHLTFVRSTQLDSNWTWQQVRQMQLGGNSNALTFFRQHNCVSNDAQQKYKSRAAQLYRDKLHSIAAQAMRVHGTKLFIDASQNTQGAEDERKDNEGDFFEKHQNEDEGKLSSNPSSSSLVVVNADLSDQGPNVEAALSMTHTKQEPRKATIGGRKPAAKKGLGGKKVGKGLGAQKVKKDFAEIEREAELADQIRDKLEDEKKEVTQEDEEKVVESMRLAYQDLSVARKKKEETLRTVDPKKAEQVERLGMGAGAKSGGITHSSITGMTTITQEEPRGSMAASSSRSYKSGRREFDDDFDNFGGFDRDEDDWPSSRSSRNDDFGSSNSWEKEFEVLKSSKSSSGASKSEWNNNYDAEVKTESSYGSRRGKSTNDYSSNPDEAQKKFGTAKAISSDMYFSGDSNSGPDANLSRFSGSNSISSAEYFGRQETAPSYNNMSAPDMEDVKESVKQGVSKVAGRLSNMASGVMNQIQDRYGY